MVQQRSGSILAQVLARWLMEPSCYLKLCWLIFSCGIHLRATSEQMRNISILDMGLQSTNSRLQTNLQGQWVNILLFNCPYVRGPNINYTIVWFLRAPRWYISPTAMPRAAVAPEWSEGAIGCDSRLRHYRRDDILAWRPNKITLLALLPLDLTMYYHFISFLRAVQSRVGH